MSVKRIKQIFAAGFILLLLLPMACTDFNQHVVSEIENRTLADFPSLHGAEGELNRNFIREFENWFNDHVGFRKQLFATNLKIQYDLFNDSANNTVLVGKDGWLFYSGGGNADIAAGEYPDFGEEALEDICQKMTRIQEKLKEQGRDFVLLLPPSKVSIYPEYMRGNFTVRETPVDQLADYLEQHTDIKVVRMKEALLEEKEKTDELLYFKTDTHWNTYGSSVAYREMAKKLREWDLTDTEACQVTLIKESKTRDLMKMLIGEVDGYKEESYTKYQVINPTATLQESGKINAFVQDYVKANNIYRGDYYENTNKELPSYLVFSDSMFMSWMAAMVAENCSTLTAIQKPIISQKVINFVDPDVVFLEMGERFISDMMAPDFNESFIHVSVTRKGSEVEISYKDFGAYEKMLFPVWRDADGTDCVVWYEPERTDPNTWCAKMEIEDTGADDLYNVHFYQTDDASDSGVFVQAEAFRISELTN